MSKKSNSDIELLSRRSILKVSTVGAFTGAAISVGPGSISAEEEEDDADADSDDDDGAGDETETNGEEDDEGEDETSNGEEQEEDPSACDGSPSMSRTSVTTPNSRITTEDPAVVEANFRPDQMIPDECTIMVDLEFSFTDSGFQWGGGAEWDQATSDLVVGTFEVRPGEIRDIRAELHTQGAEAGDSVTVVADYEIWFKGNPEGSVQQSGIRHSIDVEEPNPAPEESELEGENDNLDNSLPGFGVPGALAGISGAGYLLKSKLIDGSE